MALTLLGATRRIELACLAGQKPDPDDVAVVEEASRRNRQDGQQNECDCHADRMPFGRCCKTERR